MSLQRSVPFDNIHKPNQNSSKTGNRAATGAKECKPNLLRVVVVNDPPIVEDILSVIFFPV